LRSRGIRHLVFTGIATNVCVESTLRDGFFLEYFGVVLEDATHQAGPAFAQQAALFNIETFFGWVSDVGTFCDALSPQPGSKLPKENTMPKQVIIPRAPPPRLPRLCPVRWQMAWSMSPDAAV
jgi:hypothetical protein